MDAQRIETLARQAGFVGTDLSNTVFGTLHVDALANFALLIAKECIWVAREAQAGHDDADFAIAEHFGV
jgi:hypothetical protein